MEENNRDDNEIDKYAAERKAGFTAGSLFAYVLAGCMCALVIGATLKILQWMLF